MDDLLREKKKGFSYWYMKDVLLKRKFLVIPTIHKVSALPPSSLHL